MRLERILIIALLVGLLVAGCSQDTPVQPQSQEKADTDTEVAARPVLYCLGDRVWLDTNQNGCQDEGEPGIAGVEVNLLTGCETREHGSVQLQKSVASVVTDETGYYEFCDLISGQYRIQFKAPEGYVFCERYSDACGEDADSNAGPDGMTDCITLSYADDMTIDAGLCTTMPETYCLGDYVWYDMNGDGCQDEGELGAPDVEVNLWTGCPPEQMVATAVTDPDGMYSFCGLMPGDYTVQFTAPSGYGFCMQYAVGCGAEYDSDAAADGITGCVTIVDADDWTIDAGLCELPDEGCTRSQGYWKNHANKLEPLLPVWLGDADGAESVEVTDSDQAVMILGGNSDNGIAKLYVQLLAAKLNFAAGASDADVADTVEVADAFLADHGLADWWMLCEEDRQMVLEWKDIFDWYNNGIIGPGYCH